MADEKDEFLDDNPTEFPYRRNEKRTVVSEANETFVCGIGRVGATFIVVATLVLAFLILFATKSGGDTAARANPPTMGDDPSMEHAMSTPQPTQASGNDILPHQDQTDVSLHLSDEPQVENPNSETPSTESNGETTEEHDLSKSVSHAALTLTASKEDDAADTAGNETYADEAVDWIQTLEGMKKYDSDCQVALQKHTVGTYAYEMVKADCGMGYQMPDPAKSKPFKVGLVGHWTPAIQFLSGFELGHSCPMSPNCQIVMIKNLEHAREMNAYVTPAYNYDLMRFLSKKPNQYRVLYWREAMWTGTPSAFVQYEKFDVEMGVHYMAGLNNPAFVMQPSFLLKGLFQDTVASEFAASVISDCSTLSRREVYIGHLERILGKDKIHRYGKCGDRKLPATPWRNALAVLSKYKFYLSFENTIQRGYTSEKLFSYLMLPFIPIYYGDPLVTNITTTPSFIKVSDFKDPTALTQHLLFLDANPEEYAKYHAWRKNPRSILPEYLKTLQNVPGPKETMAHLMNRTVSLSQRKAMSCRICNEEYLRDRVAHRTHHDLVNKTYTRFDLGARFYGISHFAP